RDSDVMRLKVQGQIGELKPENFPGFKSDACSNMGVECPLVAGKQYTAKSQLTISPTFSPRSGALIDTAGPKDRDIAACSDWQAVRYRPIAEAVMPLSLGPAV
ncbi:hypothetical protein HPB47_024944, partial [Ixodes persulcatus]